MYSFGKRTKKENLERNKAIGQVGEFYAGARHAFDKPERTGRGHDLKVKTFNPKTWKEETKYIEVKTGNAKLSPLQKKEKKKKGSRYKVERYDI
jgi:hypothetical protein